MNRTFVRLLLKLYPRWWRERYGEEFELLLRAGPGGLRASVDVAASALREYIVLIGGLPVNAYASSVIALTRKPSALVPLAMSVTALAIVLGHFALFGVVHEADEGAVAHIWQILMAGQLPVAAYFAIKWMPRATRQTLTILAVLAVVLVANFAAVYFLT